MPYITREDGERFIIPSYRDTVSVKKVSLLKKEITLLSANYGEYITLQKKTLNQYEIAFSPDPGYLLGECVWQYFKRPYDMIYCEAIPNTNEAILVIVKSGSVYLDGSFPIDSIAEELIIFKTQKNAFNIYIYGDVPISQQPEDGKISFDANSVSSFTILDQPVFPTLPVIKAFQLQLVDVVLRSQGIGILPVKNIVITCFVIVLFILGYYYVTSGPKIVTTTFIRPSNPYEGYYQALSSPDPKTQLENLYQQIIKVYSLPGWRPVSFDYTPGFPARIRVGLVSMGAKMESLMGWARRADATLELNDTGAFITLLSVSPPRPRQMYIVRMNDVIAAMVDRMSYIFPGNSIQISKAENKNVYSQMDITVTLGDSSPLMLLMVGNAVSGLPLVLTSVQLKQSDLGVLTGQINFKALGN